ncbi:hypothetical protein CO2235_MP20180 [Cupriavidus oxalaticus]|uniref:Uncharacterized protein n=1 Tax=Cupriavidus oxalaticus TaxID=96344 RepID=A0A375GGX5_9BURK|nr:hypothetical protein CO2235_MP20180 [Cupriavidus oxalaticus]
MPQRHVLARERRHLLLCAAQLQAGDEQHDPHRPAALPLLALIHLVSGGVTWRSAPYRADRAVSVRCPTQADDGRNTVVQATFRQPWALHRGGRIRLDISSIPFRSGKGS